MKFDKLNPHGYVIIDGNSYRLNESQEHVLYHGEWMEVLADQEGYLYIHPPMQKTIYLDDESQPKDCY